MLSSDSSKTRKPLAIEGDKSGMASTVYAKSARELNELIRLLRAGGAQTDVSLPRVAVIGNQSAGKSSLIEAIARISVPRDAGTCTRCPMELRLSSSNNPWTCRISIRWEFDASGAPLAQATETPFGERFTDDGLLEPMLRRAQTAVLNQDHDTSYFVDLDAEAVKLLAQQAKQNFSRNVVCVDISAPDLPDLSFIDLPGIIQYDDGKGEVKLVEKLARSYIKSRNTLILVVSPMSDDLRNQKAVQLAKEADPDGMRTINVLTKPDALAAGSIDAKENWMQVIAGRLFPTKHGFFCVRLPDDAERREQITHAKAREREETYFATVAPWCDAAQRHRFGIDSLVLFLSDKLMDLNRASLPEIEREVDAQYAQCVDELRGLPEKTAEPHLYVYRLATAFADEVARLVQGSPAHTALVQANKAAYATFSGAIAQTAPPFVPFVSPYASGAGGTIYLNTVRAHIDSCLTRELPNNVPYNVKCTFIYEFQVDWEKHVMRCRETVRRTFRDTLMRTVDHHFGRFGHLKRAVSAVVHDLLGAHGATTEQQLRFQLKYERNPPETQSTDDLARLRAEHLAIYRKMSASIAPTAFKDQTGPGFSIGTPSNAGSHPGESPFAASPSTSKQIFQFGPTSSSSPSASTTATSFSRAPPSVKQEAPRASYAPPPAPGPSTPTTALPSPLTPAQTPPSAASQYEDELALMAEIRAYFDIASKRLRDNVAHVIDEHLLYSFAEVLGDGALVDRLGMAAEDAQARCARYLEEDPDVAALREELLAKKKRLDAAQKALCEFCL